MKVSAVIPARYHSSRLPGKPLADIAGDPMIRWVYERAKKARGVDEVWVATDDERVLKAVERFGGTCCMTSPDHPSGTDRIAEAALHKNWDIIINVQGDEPLIDPGMIEAVAATLQKHEKVPMSTLKRTISSAEELVDPNVVKVVTDQHDFALYFSRAPIPYHRDIWKTVGAITPGSAPHRMFKHIGIYGYRREFLLSFAQMPPTPLEQAERLEQLRALENGYRIIAPTTEKDSLGVDSPEDLARVREWVQTRGLTCFS